MSISVADLLALVNSKSKSTIPAGPDPRLAEAVTARDAIMARNGNVTGSDLASRDAQSLEDAVSCAENDWASRDAQSLVAPAKSLLSQNDLASHDAKSLEADAQSVFISGNDLAGQKHLVPYCTIVAFPAGGA